ncbi:MAG: hypothetical protein WCW14_01535 [Candidatus Paceibacterota bacterium]|jgi:predicted transporter
MKIKTITIKILSAIILCSAFIPSYIFANADPTIENPTNATSITNFINIVVDKVVQVGLVFLILAIIYVGYLFVMARGNTAKLEEARKAFFYTIIGGLILLGAQLFALIIEETVKSLGA